MKNEPIYNLLNTINYPDDLRRLDVEQLPEVCSELRQDIIKELCCNPGHFAASLGTVELTVALHYVYNTPYDRIVWDVGHQAYTHKILTGRKNQFDQLRKFGGMSGFPKRNESHYDAFDTGHSSTSISAGLGYVSARDIKKEHYSVISVIGDGALTGGMAYEALNNASQVNGNFIIVLNDNQMSISENVGGMNQYLNSFRTSDAYLDLKDGVTNSLNRIPVVGERMVKRIRNAKSGIKQLFVPGMFFENMGITYLGPVDGTNIKEIRKVLAEAKRVRGPVLVHVRTIKGEGYLPAERHPARFHGTGPFDIDTGVPLYHQEKAHYTDVFSTVMRKMGEREPKVVAITAAMADGTGLSRFAKLFPERFFDVGIAEEHAMTFAAGLAAGGMKPVFAVYSSFLQRAYDQMIHDVALQNLPVMFAVDRAGLVGNDGETHQGIFDLSYLNSIPNMVIMSPKHKWELADMVRFGISYEGPIAIRYPRGSACDVCPEFRSPIEYGKSEILYEESDIAIIFVGHMFEEALKVREDLKEKGYDCSLINARFIKPLDAKMLDRLTKKHRLIVTIEENVKSGGFGEHVSEYLMRTGADVRVQILALPDDYVEHGNVDVLRKETGLDVESMTAQICKMYETM